MSYNIGMEKEDIKNINSNIEEQREQDEPKSEVRDRFIMNTTEGITFS